MAPWRPFLPEDHIRLVGWLVLCDLVNFTRGSAIESRVVGAIMPRIPSAVKHIDLLRLDQRKQCLKQYYSVTTLGISFAILDLLIARKYILVQAVFLFDVFERRHHQSSTSLLEHLADLSA